MASPIPVLPLVGSTTVAPGLSTPRRSASSIMATAMRSFTLPPGLSDSSLPSTVAPPGRGRWFSRTRGVAPISSNTEPATRGRVNRPVVVFSIIVLSLSETPFPRQKKLDVIHRPRDAAPLFRALPQILERDAVHHAGHRLVDLSPQFGQIGHRVPRDPSAPAAHRLEPVHRALHRPEHVADRHLVGGAREPVSARRAPLGHEQPGASQPQQHLLEVALRDVLARRDVLDRPESGAVREREIQHRLDRVLALGRDPHARPCSMSRAASFAKYVMMRSAPARRIPVSASIIARCSSSQPSCPAARIIAYSPDTEYAATGTPNSCFTRATTSRYGRAGLTITMSAPSSTSSATSRRASWAFAG